MKKKTKTLGIILTGFALTIGIAVSAGVFRNAQIVDETRAASGAHVINFWDPANLSDTATITLIDTTYVNAASTPDISGVDSVTRA